MSKKDEFKEFVRKNSNLIKYVKNNEMSWQKFYELWDLYGEENEVWNSYKEKEEHKDEDYSLTKIFNSLKNINVDSIKKNIDGVQKAISLFQQLTKKEETKDVYEPRPMYRRFED